MLVSSIQQREPVIQKISVQSLSRARLFATPWLQHARLPCPAPTPRACSNSCPLSLWCRPTISSSVIPFSSCLQSFLASGSFPRSQFFASVFSFSISLSKEYSGLFEILFLYRSLMSTEWSPLCYIAGSWLSNKQTAIRSRECVYWLIGLFFVVVVWDAKQHWKLITNQVSLIFSLSVNWHYIKQMINHQNYYSSVYFLDHIL